MYAGYGSNLMTYTIDQGSTMNIVATNFKWKSWEGPWVVPADYEMIRKTFEGYDETPKKVVDVRLSSVCSHC